MDFAAVVVVVVVALLKSQNQSKLLDFQLRDILIQFRFAYVNVAAVDGAEKGFVEIYSEVVPMTAAADRVNVDAIMDYVDGHDFVSCAAIDDFPMMMLAIGELKHVVAFVMGCPT